MSSFYEQYLAELAKEPVVVVPTWFAMEALLDEAGIMARDFPLFCERRGGGGYAVRMEQAKGHVLNVNSPYNVHYVPGVHRRGSEV